MTDVRSPGSTGNQPGKHCPWVSGTAQCTGTESLVAEGGDDTQTQALRVWDRQWEVLSSSKQPFHDLCAKQIWTPPQVDNTVVNHDLH